MARAADEPDAQQNQGEAEPDGSTLLANRMSYKGLGHNEHTSAS